MNAAFGVRAYTIADGFSSPYCGQRSRSREPVVPREGSFETAAPSGIVSTNLIKPRQHFPGSAFAGSQQSRTGRAMAFCDPGEPWRVYWGLKTVYVLKP